MSTRAQVCVAALAAFLSMPISAHADTASRQINVTTMQMISWCEPVENADLHGNSMTVRDSTHESEMCWGVFAALEALSFDYNDQGESILGICPPATTSISRPVVQMVRIFDSYARRHPETLHQNYELTALTALRSAFPCK